MESAYGYDGNGIMPGSRVEFHPGTNLWIRGARYGTIQRLYRSRFGFTGAIVRVDATGRNVRVNVTGVRAVY